MKIKTLAELQQKGWYRLIKVLFVLSLLLTYGVTVGAIVISASPTVDHQKTQIRCLLGNGKTFTADDLGLYLTTSDFTDSKTFDYKRFFERYYSTEYDVRDILEACSTQEYPDFSNANIFKMQASVEVKYDDSIPDTAKTEELTKRNQAIDRNYGSDSVKFLSFEPQIFSIEPAYTDNTATASGQVLIATVVIFGAFELIRRIFYYVLLGTWTPNKQEKNQ